MAADVPKCNEQLYENMTDAILSQHERQLHLHRYIQERKPSRKLTHIFITLL